MNYKKFIDYMKDIGVIGTGLGVIAGVLVYIGGQLTSFTSTFKDYNDTIPLVKQLVADLKTIQDEFKAQEGYRKTVDEIKLFASYEIDFAISEAKKNIRENCLTYDNVQKLEFYQERITFLTVKQKSDIEYIKKVYYRQIRP